MGDAALNLAWERLTQQVLRCRLPFCDVTIGLVHGGGEVLLVDTGTTLTEARVLAAGGESAAYVPGHGAVVDAGFVRRQAAWLADRSAPSADH